MKVSRRLTFSFTVSEAERLCAELEDLGFGVEWSKGSVEGPKADSKDHPDNKYPELANLNEILNGEMGFL